MDCTNSRSLSSSFLLARRARSGLHDHTDKRFPTSIPATDAAQLSGISLSYDRRTVNGPATASNSPKSFPFRDTLLAPTSIPSCLAIRALPHAGRHDQDPAQATGHRHTGQSALDQKLPTSFAGRNGPFHNPPVRLLNAPASHFFPSSSAS